ncbi:MAG: hypothetical protein IJ015_05230 [Ruminococcus sp.]|nr:hypothetical protein [Ruminococcus sp.]
MKRVFCLILAILVLMLSAMTFTVSAEDKTSSDYIYFQVPTASNIAWKNFSIVFCHIWSEGNDGGDFYAWQSKNERCIDLENGYWAYDVTGLEFKEDSTYAVIFSNENGLQTYNLTLTSDCLGDIVVCDGDTCVNPVDSAKQCTVARWLTNRDTVHPVAQIGSEGGMVDPDGISNDDIDLSFGNSEGVSIEFPEVEVPTEAPTPEETEAQSEPEEEAETFFVSPLWFIIGGVILLAVVVVIIVLVIRKK